MCDGLQIVDGEVGYGRQIWFGFRYGVRLNYSRAPVGFIRRWWPLSGGGAGATADMGMGITIKLQPGLSVRMAAHRRRSPPNLKRCCMPGN